MKNFMDENFLLETDCARDLFHNAAKSEPIWDFHCHLIPSQISENKQFSNLTEVWLGGDHYKWRQMRTFGIDEKYITGNADPYDKFTAWAATVENLIGNPLYHWTHLELQRYFGIDTPLNTDTAKQIWDEANKKLGTQELQVKGILAKSNVFAIGTTDDPSDTLEEHLKIKNGKAAIGTIGTKVVPSFRPDKALNIDAEGFLSYIKKLAQSADMSIENPDDVCAALEKRLAFFISAGCKASDHALESPPVPAAKKEQGKKSAFESFKKIKNGASLNEQEIESYKAYVLCNLAQMYRKNDVVMQLHFAAIRNNNPVQMNNLGPDTGFDASHDKTMSYELAKLLARMEEDGGLPKTILYTLNPKDYYPLGTLMGCYQGGIKGKIQLGSAWWFCDHHDGMREQMKVLGNLGMLSAFVGMLTDSRSFLSYPRHEYFRRIMCNIIGSWVENGEYPNDKERLYTIVKNISFTNAKNYFGE